MGILSNPRCGSFGLDDLFAITPLLAYSAVLRQESIVLDRELPPSKATLTGNQALSSIIVASSQRACKIEICLSEDDEVQVSLSTEAYRPDR